MDKRPSAPAPQTDGNPSRPRPNSSVIWILLIVGAVFLLLYASKGESKVSEVKYGFFFQELLDDNVVEARIEGRRLHGKFELPPLDPEGKKGKDGNIVQLKERFVTVLPDLAFEDQELNRLLRENVGTGYSAEEPADNTLMLFADGKQAVIDITKAVNGK